MASNILRKCLFYILLFCYWYSLDFSLTPLTTKMVMGLCGIIAFVTRPRQFFPKKLIVWFVMIIALNIWSVFVKLANGTSEFLYIKNIISFVMNFFAVYLVYYVGSRFLHNTNTLLKSVVKVVTIQMVITIILYFIPSLKEFAYSIQNIGELANNDYFTTSRMIGLGSAIYFGVLPTSTFASLLCIYLYFNSDSNKKQIKHLIAAIFIIGISFFIARTSVFILFATLLLYMYLSWKRKYIKSVIYISLIAVLSPFIFVSIINFFDSSMQEWVMQIFSLDKTDDSTSYGTLYSWLTETHFSTKTLLIGDGKYDNYYGGIDIGYIRHIYYGGIIDLVLFLVTQYIIISSLYKQIKNIEYKRTIQCIIILYFIIFIKGDASFTNEALLIYVVTYYIGKNNLLKQLSSTNVKS